ncbi:MAG: hypothetical protein ABMA64_23600, partial [Myxococcota bacterium]
MWNWLIAAHAAEPTVGGSIQPVVSIDLPQADDFDEEDQVLVDTWARGFAKGELPRGDLWFVEARVQHHLQFGEDTEGWWEASIGDSGWDGKIAGSLRARAGVLTERWGTLDLLPVSDVLNPREGRSGLAIPGEWAKVPVPMGVISFGNDTIRAETVLIPFSTADRMWVREQNWSFVRQGMLADELVQIKTEGGWVEPELSLLNSAATSVASTPVSARRLSDAAINGRNVPEALLANGEIAERVDLSAGGVDLGLMFGYLRARQPESAVAPVLQGILQTGDSVEVSVLSDALSAGPIAMTWPRTGVVGLDGSTLVGPVQVRLDTMYQSARPVRTFWGGGTSVPYLGAGLGLDYVRGSNFFVTLESRWQHLVDPPDDLLLSIEDQ